MSHPRYSMGLDVGVTYVKIVCVTATGELLEKRAIDTNSSDLCWPERIGEHVLRVQEWCGGGADTIGVSGPGIAAADGRSIYWMQGRLAEIEALDWAKLLKRERVSVLNDAQAALLGETWLGAAAGCHNVMLLTLGTGVGGAAVVDGHLLKGHIGRAGHLGHICLDPQGKPDVVGTRGSLEDAIGNCTVMSRTSDRFNSTLELAKAHLAGDAEASAVWLRSIHHLACGIASLINVLDPEAVVIGGGVAAAGTALFEPLEREIEKLEWRPHGHRVRIVPAKLGEYAGAYGAAWNAMNEPAQPLREGP